MSSSELGSSSSLLQGRHFYCREWALDKLRRCLDARSMTGQMPGLLVTGGPGTGKTALCTEVVWPTSKAGLEVGLAPRCLAYHFCQREDQRSTVLWRFVLALVEQLKASPHLPSGYKEILNSPCVSSSLEPVACQRDPDDTFKRFVFYFKISQTRMSFPCFYLFLNIAITNFMLNKVLLKKILGDFEGCQMSRGRGKLPKIHSMYLHVHESGSSLNSSIQQNVCAVSCSLVIQ